MNNYRARRILSDNRGTTLVEVIITMTIASIAITGLVAAYVDAIHATVNTTNKMMMYSEAEASLTIISRKIRHSYYVNTNQAWQDPNDILVVRGSDVDGLGYAEAEFYLNNGCLLWNDRGGDFGRFALRLIPLYDYDVDPGEDPYITVREVAFTGIDPVRPTNPTTEGFALIKVDLKLLDANGDSLQISEIIAKRNKPQ